MRHGQKTLEKKLLLLAKWNTIICLEYINIIHAKYG